MLKKQGISAERIRFLAGAAKTEGETAAERSSEIGIIPVFRPSLDTINTYKMTGTSKRLSCII